MVNIILIGISGGSCSGKTTMANLLTEKFENPEKSENYANPLLKPKPLRVTTISEDDYYHDTETLKDTEFFDGIFDDPLVRDHDLLVSHINQLKAGNNVNAPVYDFVNHKRSKDTQILSPSDIIIIEGTHIYCNAQLRDLFDYKIYLDIDDGQKFNRRMKRDTQERGREPESVVQQYKGVQKAYNEFTAPTKAYADFVIDHAFDNNSIAFIYSDIRQIL